MKNQTRDYNIFKQSCKILYTYLPVAVMSLPIVRVIVVVDADLMNKNRIRQQLSVASPWSVKTF